MTILLASSEVQQNFGRVMDRAMRESDVVVERYGAPRVVIVDYQRYQQLVESEQHLLKTRLQEASRTVSARAAKLSDGDIDGLIEQARTDVAAAVIPKIKRKVSYATRPASGTRRR